jgi:hypothetical protein
MSNWPNGQLDSTFFGRKEMDLLYLEKYVVSDFLGMQSYQTGIKPIKQMCEKP